MPHMRRILTLASTVTMVLALAACTTASGEANDPAAGTPSSSDFYDASSVHTISVTFDDDEYQAMLETYAETGDKEWISATVTIDGVTYENVGLKLKGNSSLRGLAEVISGDAENGGMSSDLSPDEPEGLPWRIRLDEFVDGQEHDGETDFVVRGSSSETAINEAVALELLDEAGLAAQDAAATRFSVNGSDETLRLVVQNPDDEDWYEAEVDDNGIFFKAESGGDYSYRGDDYTAYTDAFSLEGNPEDLADDEAYAPLIAFLDFLNNSDDETFAAELGDHLDVEAFALYLAFEELVGNTDDIDGPGNNAYLAYDPDTGLITVVAWDHNLALGSGMGGGFGDGQGPGGGRMPEAGETPDGELPEDMTPPEDGQLPDAESQGGGLGSQDNVLVQRFEENEEFAALISAATESLQADLVDSGYATDVLDQWTTLLTEQAGDLVSIETIESESAAVAQALGISDS